MELSAQDALTLLAMVDRINKEKAVLACQVEWLIDMLVQKGLMTDGEKHAFHEAVRAQRDVSRTIQVAENEPKEPAESMEEPLPVELTRELTSLGVVSEAPTVADMLDTDFEELLQKVVKEFRRRKGPGGHDGEAGNVAEV